MEMRLQPNAWSCLPAAFAMAMGTTPAILIKQLGHDGSDVWWLDNPEPYNRRGFHIQEIVHVAWLMDWYIVCFQSQPVSGSNYCFKQHPVPIRDGLFEGALKSTSGVLVGRVNDKQHAVAWNKEQVLDPNGSTYSIDNFSIREFYGVVKR